MCIRVMENGLDGKPTGLLGVYRKRLWCMRGPHERSWRVLRPPGLSPGTTTAREDLGLGPGSDSEETQEMSADHMVDSSSPE